MSGDRDAEAPEGSGRALKATVGSKVISKMDKDLGREAIVVEAAAAAAEGGSGVKAKIIGKRGIGKDRSGDFRLQGAV